jgi:hypothetical protein
MIRMLIVGYVFAIRSERRLCSEVQVNLAYTPFPIIQYSVVRGMSVSRQIPLKPRPQIRALLSR